jgi:hypothetical protein
MILTYNGHAIEVASITPSEGGYDIMGLFIHDGYTLPFNLHVPPFPRFTGLYRPALMESVNAWRYAPKKDEVDARTRLLQAHLVSWDCQEPVAVLRKLLGADYMKIHHPDVTDDKKLLPVPITEAILRTLPDPVLLQLFNVVIGYGVQEDLDAKN